MALNPNAQKWVEALRSGKYQQGRGGLHLIKDGDEMFCCLGVACEIYSQEVEKLPTTDFEIEGGRKFTYGYEANYLPTKVREWLGLASKWGWYGPLKHSVPDVRMYELAIDNDEGKTFENIAAIIESEPEGLFA